MYKQFMILQIEIHLEIHYQFVWFGLSLNFVDLYKGIVIFIVVCAINACHL
jgi:hypothetical protein